MISAALTSYAGIQMLHDQEFVFSGSLSGMHAYVIGRHAYGS